MNRNLEPRDKLLCIKELKQQYTPKMYERSHWNDDGKLCNKSEQAEQAATFLEKKQWGDHLHEGDEFHLNYLISEDSRRFYLNDIDIDSKFNTGEITVEEIKSAIKTMANNKSGGIDNCTAEVLKFRR